MRPHLLELEAFGAFPDAVRLDFDAIGRFGLVLLCGDTGGGKTTLLDALGFALYGVVPGERNKALTDLRSHHAPASATARVRLEFTARGRRLRVTRSPAQSRPKRRGDGVVVDNPTALLESWDGTGWTPLAQRPEDVGHEIGRLLGMDASQFFQVVVLPQGRFAAFLQADHRDREKLLKQLFHVDRFEWVERWLADRSATGLRSVEQARQALSLVAARVAQAAGSEAPADLEAADGWAQHLADTAEGLRARAAAEAVVLQQARVSAERELAQAEILAQQQQDRRLAEAELAVLQEKATAIAALQAEREAADRVRPVQVALAAQDEAAAARTEAEHQTRQALQVLAPLHDAGTLDEAQLRTLASDRHREVGRLEALDEVVARAAAEAADAVASTAAAEACDVQLSAAREALLDLPARRRQAEDQLEQGRQAMQVLPQLRVEHQQAQEQEELLAQLLRTQEQQSAAATRVATAQTEADLAQTEAQEVHRDRVDALIAQLAGTLVDDVPCPVCGSTSHPEVSELSTDDVGEAAERAARERAGLLAAAAQAQQLTLAQLDERLAGLQQRVHPCAGSAAELGEQVVAHEATVAAAAPAAAVLTALQSEADTWNGQAARLETRVQDERKRADEAAATASDLLARLVEELGEGVDLAGRRAEAAAVAVAAADAATALSRSAAATVAVGGASATAARLVAGAGFGAESDARDAVRDTAWSAEAVRQLDDHRDQLSGVRARLAGLDVDLVPAAPVELCRTTALEVAGLYGEAHDHERVLAGQAAALAKLVAPISAAVAVLGPLRQEAAELKGLAEVAAGRGTNRLSMPLSTYVLAARLEEVAQAASQRLSRMTDRRYTLSHTDGSRDKRSRAGLGLQVLDSWTGRTRDTATLSGGETFMTALSLALGLADVVTAEAGGQSIDALFVDEGFGTLDADSLDKVMDVLDELRSGGRLVGVVSHVPDLRLRIPVQIRVLKSEAGSRVEVV